jgi:GT2 family glycosyltransferase
MWHMMSDRTRPLPSSNLRLDELPPPVATVVLNWKSWRRTVQCVTELNAGDYPNSCIIVVDNNSGDGSEQQLRWALPDVEIIQTGANLGYAGGNNVGICRALELGAKFVLILNPDVSLQPKSLSTLVSHCAGNPKLAAVCPIVRWRDDPERVWFGGGIISWCTASARHLYAAPAGPGLHASQWASGCCVLLAADALRQVGMFDQDFFLYWEEVDLCQRLLESGFSVAVASDAVAYHDVSHAIGLDSAPGWYYFVRNAFYFFSRHAPAHHVPRASVVVLLYLKLALAGSLKAALNRDGTASARLLGATDFARGRRGSSPRFSGH